MDNLGMLLKPWKIIAEIGADELFYAADEKIVVYSATGWHWAAWRDYWTKTQSKGNRTATVEFLFRCHKNTLELASALIAESIEQPSASISNAALAAADDGTSRDGNATAAAVASSRVGKSQRVRANDMRMSPATGVITNGQSITGSLSASAAVAASSIANASVSGSAAASVPALVDANDAMLQSLEKKPLPQPNVHTPEEEQKSLHHHHHDQYLAIDKQQYQSRLFALIRISLSLTEQHRKLLDIASALHSSLRGMVLFCEYYNNLKDRKTVINMKDIIRNNQELIVKIITHCEAYVERMSRRS